MDGEETGVQNMRTGDVYRVDRNLPKRFNHPDCFKGYGPLETLTHKRIAFIMLIVFYRKKVHPLYRTTNQTYGSQKPTVHEMPTTFHGSRRTFSEDLLQTGMFRDNGFNTALERSGITEPNAIAVFQDRITFHLSDHITKINQTESNVD